MPYYHKAGKFPEKRHTQFRKPNGELYAEELVSTEGFSSIYSLVYHCHPPTLVKHIGEPIDVAPKAAIANNMQNRSFITFKTEAKSGVNRFQWALDQKSVRFPAVPKPQADAISRPLTQP